MIVSEKKLAANRANAQLAGRPKGAIEDHTLYAREFRKYLCRVIEENKGPLIKAMLDKAKGGDVQAFHALFDRAMGKPAQAVEMSGTEGQPIVFMPLALIQKFALEEAEKPLQKNVIVVNNEEEKQIESKDMA